MSVAYIFIRGIFHANIIVIGKEILDEIGSPLFLIGGGIFRLPKIFKKTLLL